MAESPMMSRLEDQVVTDAPLPEVLEQIVKVAAEELPGVDSVSVTLAGGKQVWTEASSSEISLVLDEAQYELGYGPCIDAGMAGQIFLVQDIREESRWNAWVDKAIDAGMGSSLSVPLPFQGSIVGALNCYSRSPGILNDEDLNMGLELASFVGRAVATSDSHLRTGAELRQMREAMRTRAVIEQAKGILMGRHRCSEDEAFVRLSRRSQTANRKLRDVAADLVHEVQTSRTSRNP